MNVFRLPSSGAPSRLALAWLMLGLVALFASNLFAVLLVLLRTTQLSQWLGKPAFFHTALALHVNLAVLVWFLAFAGTLWSLVGGKRGWRLGWLAWYLGVMGGGLLLLSPWLGHSQAVLSNYLPILQQPVFLSGLAFFAAGILLAAVRACLTLWQAPVEIVPQPHWFGLLAAAIALLVSFIAFAHAAWQLWPTQTLNDLPEIFFWGGGHLLQFIHTFLMLTIWIWLAEAAAITRPWSQRVLALWFIVGLLPPLVAPLFFLGLHPQSGAYRLFFTQLMAYGSWLAVPAIGGTILWHWLRQGATPDITPEQRLLRSTILLSITLFTLGIGLGTQITGSSVLITAHYHGTVGAITLAYMGATLHLLSVLGLRSPKPLGFANRWQPRLYGGGLFLLILGLAWLGGLGVPRKTPLALHALATWEEKVGVIMLGVGGGIGLAGGFLFLLLVAKVLRNGRKGV